MSKILSDSQWEELRGSGRVVGIDPGGATGWAAMDVDWGQVDPRTYGFRVRRWKSGEILGGDSTFAIDALFNLVLRFDARVLVIEDFILDISRASGQRSLLLPVRVTSGLEARLAVSGWDGVIVKQSAANAKTIVTNQRLRSWGYWTIGSGHARDATRHALLCLRKLARERGGVV